MAKPTLSAAAIAEIAEIARRELGVETLERRGRDSLNSYELHVWTLRAALEAAYLAGMVDHYRSG